VNKSAPTHGIVHAGLASLSSPPAVGGLTEHYSPSAGFCLMSSSGIEVSGGVPPNVRANHERTKWVKNCIFVKSSNMSTVELRHTIIEKISQIEDTSFLRAIKTIVESKVNEDVYKLSDFQKKRVKESREQVKLGQTISNDTLQKEISEWLGTR
jgi:hypothetical protein